MSFLVALVSRFDAKLARTRFDLGNCLCRLSNSCGYPRHGGRGLRGGPATTLPEAEGFSGQGEACSEGGIEDNASAIKGVAERKAAGVEHQPGVRVTFGIHLATEPRYQRPVPAGIAMSAVPEDWVPHAREVPAYLVKPPGDEGDPEQAAPRGWPVGMPRHRPDVRGQRHLGLKAAIKAQVK